MLGIGLAGVNALRAAGEDLDGVRNAVDFIAELRQTADKSGNRDAAPGGFSAMVTGGPASTGGMNLGAVVSLRLPFLSP